MKTILLSFVLAAAGAAQMLQMGETSEGFVSIYNGRDLGQWDGDPRLWKVVDRLLTGSTEGVEPLKANSFLIYRGREYQNFELRLDIRLRNHNSGIQFRSTAGANWSVKGLQADAAEGNWWGSIYDEGGTRGIIVNGWKDKAEKIVKPGEWNEYSILCQGGVIRLRVNGVVTAELANEPPRRGVIALQLHMGPPMRVEFRNIRIREL